MLAVQPVYLQLKRLLRQRHGQFCSCRPM